VGAEGDRDGEPGAAECSDADPDGAAATDGAAELPGAADATDGAPTEPVQAATSTAEIARMIGAALAGRACIDPSWAIQMTR